MHIRLVNVYLLNVPSVSVSSPYFNKIKRTSHLGKWHALLLEILTPLEWLEIRSCYSIHKPKWTKCARIGACKLINRSNTVYTTDIKIEACADPENYVMSGPDNYFLPQ